MELSLAKMDNSMLNNKNRIFSLATYMAGCLLSFGIMSSANADVCGSPEDDDYFGNARTCPFKNAIEGTEALTDSDRAFLSSVYQTRVIDRWYVRLLIGKPKVKLDDLSNSSNGGLSGFPLTQTSFTQDLYQGLLAGGHVWQQWAVEAELFFSKKFSFTENPVFSGVPVAAWQSGIPLQTESELNQFALFFNVHYIIPRYFNWYPTRLQAHINAGAGIGLKTTSTNAFSLTGAPFESNSNRTISGVGNLGVGARYQITPNILVDVDYRYIYMGKATFGPVMGVQYKTDKIRSNDFFFGATYQY
jgi:opacity protein-like surface antigen